MPTFSAQKLTEFAGNLLTAGGLEAEEATAVAESLVGANLRGYDSHGVMRLPYYLDRLEKDQVMPAAEFEVLLDCLLYTSDAADDN